MNSFILSLFVAVASVLVLSTAMPASDLAESAPAPLAAPAEAPRGVRSPKDLTTAESGWGWGGHYGHYYPYVYSSSWGYPSHYGWGYDWPYYGYGWGHYGHW